MAKCQQRNPTRPAVEPKHETTEPEAEQHMPEQIEQPEQQGCLQNLRVVESSGAIEDSIATTAPEPNVFAEDAHNASELLHDSNDALVDSIATADPGPNAFAVDAHNASKLLQKPCVSASDGVCKKPDVSSGACFIGLSRQQLETIKHCATNKPWATVLHVGKLKVASLSSSLRTIQC